VNQKTGKLEVDDVKVHKVPVQEDGVWTQVSATPSRASISTKPIDLSSTNFDGRRSLAAVSFERPTVLYADLVGSTALVDGKNWYFAAEIYKSYLHCVAKLVRNEGGDITSYDGDRLMGVFVGGGQSTSAARCALKIKYAVEHIVNPAIAAGYQNATYRAKHVVGIDTSKIHAARTGVRGDNDLVWVGRAANYAAKLTQLRQGQATWITQEVF
jgi:class 3 adenylate cyclase